MAKKIMLLLWLVFSLLPLKMTEALSLPYVVNQQVLTIELASDGSAKIEDRLHYSGPANFKLTYTIYQPSTMKEQLSPTSAKILNLADLNVSIEVINLETGESQPVERSLQAKENYYYAYTQGDTVLIDLQMVDHGAEYGLVFHYELENVVTNYQDAAVIEPLKAIGGPLQQYTASTVRLILPEGLDLSDTETNGATETNGTTETNVTLANEIYEQTEPEGDVVAEITTDGTDTVNSPDSSAARQAQISLPIAPTLNPLSQAKAHFSETLPGNLWAWLFYAENAQLTIQPGDQQTVIEIHLPKIGLNEPTEIQLTTPSDRFPDNPKQSSEPILDQLMETNRERMETAEPYEDIW